MKKLNFRAMNTIEIIGAPIAFNNAVTEQYDYDAELTFFYCDEALQSTDAANGYNFIIEDREGFAYPLSYLAMSDNSALYAVCYDGDDNEVFFKVDGDRLTKMSLEA
jgi:hypothetical protein